jgi:hypothetical protein
MQTEIRAGIGVTTGAQAVERIAEATGLLPSAVFRTARALREADPTLWPEAKKGGRRGAAHVEPRHLVNLALALAVADPVATLPDAVAIYRALICSPSPDHESRVARLLKKAGVFEVGDSLGNNLERLVTLLADPDLNTILILNEAELSIELVADRRHPRAFFSHFVNSTNYTVDANVILACFFDKDSKIHSILAENKPQSNHGMPPQPSPLLYHKGVLNISMFGLLADLWNHTRRCHANIKPDPISDGLARQSTAENETAASLPGDTAAPNQSQPNIAKQRSGTSETSEVTPKRKISQRAFGRAAAGHSTPIQERPVHDLPHPPDSATVRGKRPKRRADP